MSSSAPGPGGSALAWAEQAHALVQARPRAALALAERALAAAAAAGDVHAEVAARHALGWAQHTLGDAHLAGTTLRGGIRLAEKHGHRRGAGLLRRHLAVWLAMDGKLRAAQRELDAALALLVGRDLAHSQVHRIEIHRKTQTLDPDLHRRICADAAEALRRLRRDGDEIWEARLRFNRGLLYFDRGELDAAEADLRHAHALYSRLGADVAAMDVVVVTAELALLRGDILTCLKTLDEVEATLATADLAQDDVLFNLGECRLMALARARLLPEAQAAGEAYTALCARTGHRDFVALAALDLAAIALMAGDPARARRSAAAAIRSFAVRGKLVNAALARSSSLRARLLDASLNRSSLRSGLEAASVLESAGWRRDALRARLVAARVALAVGSTPTARRQLDLAQPLRTLGTATDRIELCHARALLRIVDGDRAGAERLLAQGLRLLDSYRAALGAAELRATASGIGAEIAQTGLRIALESTEAPKVLVWAERLRGNALRLPTVRPPSDPDLRALQAELRRTGAQLRAAEERGATAPGAAANQARLEAAIRTRTRLLQGEGEARSPLLRPHDAARSLGGRVLVEYVELEGVLRAVTLARGRLALHELGPDTTGTELEWLRFALRRLAHGGHDATLRAAGLASADAAASALDALLVDPLLPAIGDAPLVIVPTGALHALPWGVLPSLRGRPLVVAPSLSVWLGLEGRPRSRRRKAALVAGPRLRHSAAEVKAVGSLVPNTTVLHGRHATAQATLAALDGAALAHLACHGHFRSDSPLFSSLELADGPLNVYELQTLKRAPEVVVLSACDLALSDLHPGDELLGLAAALLGMGTRTIVASVVPVPDAAAKRMMLAFHRRLAAGETPAAALAQAQARAAVPGFVCLGSG